MLDNRAIFNYGWMVLDINDSEVILNIQRDWKKDARPRGGDARGHLHQFKDS